MIGAQFVTQRTAKLRGQDVAEDVLGGLDLARKSTALLLGLCQAGLSDLDADQVGESGEGPKLIPGVPGTRVGCVRV